MKKLFLQLITVIILFGCQEDNNLATDKPIISKYYLSVNSDLKMQGGGQTSELIITSNCTWEIRNAAEWLVISDHFGNNSQVVTVTAQKNTTDTLRTATLSIKGGDLPERIVTVTQEIGNYVQEPETPKEPSEGDNFPPE